MRSIVFAVALMPAAASVAKSQEAQPVAPATQLTAQAQPVPVAPSVGASNVRLVDEPIGITHAQARATAPASNNLTRASAAAVDPDTRNTLAIVGAVVIVIALLAFLL